MRNDKTADDGNNVTCSIKSSNQSIQTPKAEEEKIINTSVRAIQVRPRAPARGT
jgi:hypothetical protein